MRLTLAFVAATLLAAGSAHTGASCQGDACTSLRLKGCTLTNVGDQAISVSIESTSGTLGYDRMEPGADGDLRGMFGCIATKDINSYEVNLVDGTPSGDTPTGEAVARQMGFAEPHPCVGSACARVSIETENNCVWLHNDGSDRVEVDVHLANGALHLSLLGSKPAENASSPSAGRADIAECKQAEISAQLLKDSGVDLGDAPEIMNVLTRCEAEDAAAAQAAAAPVAEAAGGYRTNYDQLNNTWTDIYWAKVKTGAGCVADPNDIRDYTAN